MWSLHLPLEPLWLQLKAFAASSPVNLPSLSGCHHVAPRGVALRRSGVALADDGIFWSFTLGVSGSILGVPYGTFASRW